MRVVRLVPSVVRGGLVAVCLSGALPAFAQPASQPVLLPEIFTAAPPRLAVETVPAPPLLQPRGVQTPQRPAALFPLYGSLIALQGLDIHSTRRSLASGTGREVNPAMRPVVQNSAAFIAVKASATAGVIWASEKMWKKNRKAAVIFTALVNTAMAAVVAHNYSMEGKR